MLFKDEGVVLKSGRSGDTSKLITFFGRRSGKIKLIGKGALGERSPFRGGLEVGNLIEAVYYYKEGRSLYFLKEVHVRSTLGDARRSLPHLASALGVLEVLDAVCYWGSPEERIVDLIGEYLACRVVEDPIHLYLVFEFKLLEILGVVPDFSSCALCGGEMASGFYVPAEGTSVCARHGTESARRIRLDAPVVEHIRGIGSRSLHESSGLAVDPKVRKRLGRILHWTYTFHIQGYTLPEALKLMPKGGKI